jgi:hypothetical protein
MMMIMKRNKNKRRKRKMIKMRKRRKKGRSDCLGSHEKCRVNQKPFLRAEETLIFCVS